MVNGDKPCELKMNVKTLWSKVVEAEKRAKAVGVDVKRIKQMVDNCELVRDKRPEVRDFVYRYLDFLEATR